MIPVAEKAIRTMLVYAALLLLLHLAGKRQLAQLNSFDLVVLLLLSNVVQNAIIGNDTSLSGACKTRVLNSMLQVEQNARRLARVVFVNKNCAASQKIPIALKSKVQCSIEQRMARADECCERHSRWGDQ